MDCDYLLGFGNAFSFQFFVFKKLEVESCLFLIKTITKNMFGNIFFVNS